MGLKLDGLKKELQDLDLRKETTEWIRQRKLFFPAVSLHFIAHPSAAAGGGHGQVGPSPIER